MFRQVERIEKVTAADVKRVANSTFVPTNRTIGVIESTQLATAGGAQ
jgi:predicted Zn-dependent peptidase